MATLRAQFRYHWFHRVKVPAILHSLSPKDVVIDAGANVGIYILKFASTGATVHAFEPHAAAFAELNACTRHLNNVITHTKAIGTQTGGVSLYLHAEAEGIDKSDCSSIVAEKHNIQLGNSQSVEVIDFSDFVKTIGPVKFVKMDIEGAEYDCIPHLIETGAIDLIENMSVETHEKSPKLKEAHDRLVTEIRHAGLRRRIDLGWL